MELVEGPTLAERIGKGAIPIEEALPIARQIAEAFEYAHEHLLREVGRPAEAETAAKRAADIAQEEFGAVSLRRRSEALVQGPGQTSTRTSGEKQWPLMVMRLTAFPTSRGCLLESQGVFR